MKQKKQKNKALSKIIRLLAGAALFAVVAVSCAGLLYNVTMPEAEPENDTYVAATKRPSEETTAAATPAKPSKPAGPHYQVTADVLNVRDASNRELVIGKLIYGEVIEGTGFMGEGQWVTFLYDGKEAAAYKRYLSETEAEATVYSEPPQSTDTAFESSGENWSEAAMQTVPTETAAARPDSETRALSAPTAAVKETADFDKTCYWSFSFPSHHGTRTSTITYDAFPLGAYEYYKAQPRIYTVSKWDRYLTDEFNHSVCDDLADAFLKDNDSDYDAVVDAIAFVQEFDYVPDGDTEYPKYPIETIYDKGGDCEDTALLLCGIIRSMKFGSALIIFHTHCGVGVLGDDSMEGTYFEVDGNRYYYVESTGTGWKIGEMPEKYKGQSAKVIIVK